jgi:uncharacterized membrane protein (DUF373 family)
VRERGVFRRDDGCVVHGEHADPRFFERGLHVAIGANLLRVVARAPRNGRRTDAARQRSQRRGGRSAPHDQPRPGGADLRVERRDRRAKERRTARRAPQALDARRIDDQHRNDVTEPRGRGDAGMVGRPQIVRKREQRFQRAIRRSNIARGSTLRGHGTFAARASVTRSRGERTKPQHLKLRVSHEAAAMKRIRHPAERTAIRTLAFLERGTFFIIGLLLFAAALSLLARALPMLLGILISGTASPMQIGTDFLDLVLLVLMVVELAYTVMLSLRGAVLSAEPFLIVGLIAVIRRILVITVGEFKGNNTNAGFSTESSIELGILTAVVLVFVASIALLRTRRRVETFDHDDD